MTTIEKVLMSGMIAATVLQGCVNHMMLRDAREVQLASAEAQMATGRLDKAMAETVMRIDANTRKGN